jgi:hypothetical protein
MQNFSDIIYPSDFLVDPRQYMQKNSEFPKRC